ncbi:dienelactone hydrolase family protein [Streptomyces caelestis]|uniref:dienelactone hydrolase family protein n=1 Tax=Streptomyces caelestis TaxID=36816 RepID=UPI00364A0857
MTGHVHVYADTKAGADYQMVAYEGAPHSFFHRSSGDWADASEDAWRWIISFTERHAQTG